MGFCNCSMFCCALLCVHSGFAIISMGMIELIALLCLSSWRLMIVVWLFITIPWVYLQFVIVVFPDHNHLLFLFCKLTAVKWPLSKRPLIGFQDQFSHNAGLKFLKNSALLLTFIKLQFVIKIFVLSIFECPFYTGLTVCLKCDSWPLRRDH